MPQLISLVAADADNSAPGISEGDTLTISFDVPTDAGVDPPQVSRPNPRTSPHPGPGTNPKPNPTPHLHLELNPTPNLELTLTLT